MSFAEFVSENQMILISLLAVAGPMLLALILFAVNKVRGLASAMKEVGKSEEDELMNIAAIAQKPASLSLDPLEDDELVAVQTSEEDEEDEDDDEDEEEPEDEEESGTPSDIQSILNDVFVDDEAMERYDVLVGDAEEIDMDTLAQFAADISDRLGASA